MLMNLMEKHCSSKKLNEKGVRSIAYAVGTILGGMGIRISIAELDKRVDEHDRRLDRHHERIKDLHNKI
ncbi:hypothetical protein AB4854_03755, partial [Pediococcus pentosaceus]